MSGFAWAKHPDGDAFLAYDIRSGFRMSMGGAERFLCQLMDGRRSIDDIAREATLALKRPIDEASVARFVEKLRSAGAMDNELGRRDRRRPWLEIEADALSAKWAARLSPLVSVRGVIAILFGFGCVAVVVAHQLPNPTRWFPLPVWVAISALALFLFSMVVHEISHGVALRSVGQPVGAIRFDPGLPGHLLSIDVTGVYRLRRRLHRMGVLMSGSLVHLTFATTAALLLVLTRRGPWAALSYCVAVMQYSMAAITLFPFVTSDGYYAWAALLDMPNLSKSARRLLRLVLRGPRWQRDAEIASLGTARTRALLVFAAGWWLWRIGGTVGSLWIVGWMLVTRLGR